MTPRAPLRVLDAPKAGPLVFGSVCSGMEAASLAWLPLGWRCAFVSEIDKTPCALLAQRFPETPNFGDMTQFKEWPDAAIDVLVGGTPCQSFSVAGLRKGLADPRGSLMLVFGAIAQRYRPRWIVWENVPGVLSADGGRAFGAFLGMLGELGYGFAYRILDAQYFGLAQRRARVFAIGYLGDWRPPAAVLFERESLRGDSPPRRKAGERVTGPVAGCSNGGGANGPGRTADDADALIAEVAPTIAARTRGGGGLGTDAECDGALIPELSYAFSVHGGAHGRQDAESETFVTHALRADGFDASEDGTGRGTPPVPVAIQAGALRENPDSGPDGVGVQEAIAYTLEARAEVQAVAFDTTQITSTANRSNPKAGDACHADYAVRRLTPTECEALQGAPLGHTAITMRGKPLADGPRYKMLGNSFAVPVVRWIGERIQLVSALMETEND